ncbi:hypothetical protein OCH239_14795 [Roseivivax halodurans JCM 10272]|uniref:Arylmalonate decarboxylase n=1 Tax=Roseivivax halodurans JCM 10272 TaxID=1449350 RepID=X7EAS1_9RHOB|nr:aspartate/glutamate racemase family protein [Roseivivax halodurans]ETX13032.1 hypothetical protein OCH239_14795 [Roseivivax halodurans JCM 10272]
MKHIGLIVPPAAGEVPPEASWMYPDIHFEARGLGLRTMSEDGYAGVVDRTIDLARDLRRSGAKAISVMGTSLSFFRGRTFEQELIGRLEDATDLPVDTMASAVARGLLELGTRRIAVQTAYRAPVNDMLRTYLGEWGLQVMTLRSLNIEAIDVVADVTAATMILEVHQLHEEAPVCDGILISCGGLRMAETSPRLRRDLRKPVVSSAEAGLWGAVGLLSPDRAEAASKVFTAPPPH